MLDRRGRLKAAGPVLVPVKNGKPAITHVAAMNLPTASVGGPARASAHAQLKSHVVKPGETLYSIAQRYDTTVETLRSANKLGAQSVIRPGLRLRLP